MLVVSMKQRDIKVTHCQSTRAYVVRITRLGRTDLYCYPVIMEVVGCIHFIKWEEMVVWGALKNLKYVTDQSLILQFVNFDIWDLKIIFDSLAFGNSVITDPKILLNGQHGTVVTYLAVIGSIFGIHDKFSEEIMMWPKLMALLLAREKEDKNAW